MITIEINNGKQKLVWATENELASLLVDISESELRIRNMHKAEDKKPVISEAHQQKLQEGRQIAKDAGIKFGRKSILSESQIAKIHNEFHSGYSYAMLASKYKVSTSTIKRAIAYFDKSLES